MLKKRITVILLAMAVFLCILAIPAVAAEGSLGGSGDPVTIKVLHTNDVHGYYADSDSVIGHDYIAGIREQFLSDLGEDSVLLLSAGDAVQGIVFANLSRGESAIEVMNAAGYGAMAPGNHEFDFGFDRLKELAEMADFPILLDDSLSGGAENFMGYKVFDVQGGYKIGVFGVTTPETAFKTNPLNVVGMDFGDKDSIVSYANAMVSLLRDDEGADAVIALVHLGVEDAGYGTSYDIANNVPGIDVIIDGHSHTLMEGGEVAGDTIITSSGASGANLGVVEIVFDDGAVTVVTPSIISKEEAAAYEPNAAVSEIIEKWNAEVEVVRGEVVATISLDLVSARANERMKETLMGNLVTDALLAASGADAVITNGGGIRDHSISAGPVTKGDLLTILPFGNVLYMAEVYGQDIKDALEVGCSLYPELNGGFSHVAGLTYEFNALHPVGNRVYNITIQGEPLNREEKYKLATNDFMAAGGDGYEMFVEPFKKLLEIETGVVNLEDALVWFLNENPGYVPKIDGRINANYGFMDMAQDDEDYLLVGKLAALGYVQGYEDSTFRPDNAITRAEFATLVSRYLNLEVPEEKREFTDVAEDNWYADTVWACAGAGLIVGYPDGSFGADRTITLEEIGIITERVVGDRLVYEDGSLLGTRLDAAKALGFMVEIAEAAAAEEAAAEAAAAEAAAAEAEAAAAEEAEAAEEAAAADAAEEAAVADGEEAAADEGEATDAAAEEAAEAGEEEAVEVAKAA